MPTVNFDLEDPGAHSHRITVDKDFDVAFLNPPALGHQIEFEMEVAHDGLTGTTWTITLPSSVRQLSTISVPPNTRGVYVFRTNDNGANYDIIQVVAGTTGTGSGSAWSTFPATQDVSMINFDLLGVKNIDFDGVSSTLEGLHNLQFAQTSQSINSLAGQIAYQGAALDTHRFIAGGTEIAAFEEITAGVYQLDMLAHKIKNSREHIFDNSTEAIVNSTDAVIGYSPTIEGGMIYNVPTGKSHIKKINDTDIMTLSENNLTFVDGHQTIFNPNSVNSGVDVGLVVGDPSATNNGDVWYNQTTHKIRTKENGVNVDVVGGGGGGGSEVPLWTQDHDADGNTLILDADGDSSISSVSDDSIQIATGGSSELSITNGFVTVSNSLIVNGNTTLGNSASDDINFNGIANTNLNMDENDITKVHTATFFDGLGNSVGEIRANNASSDVLELRLGSSSDFALTDNGTTRLSFLNTTAIWSAIGANRFDLPQEVRISDRPSAPSTPASGFAAFYVINSGGAQSFHVKFDNGTSKEIANDT